MPSQVPTIYLESLNGLKAIVGKADRYLESIRANSSSNAKLPGVDCGGISVSNVIDRTTIHRSQVDIIA